MRDGPPPVFEQATQSHHKRAWEPLWEMGEEEPDRKQDVCQGQQL